MRRIALLSVIFSWLCSARSQSIELELSTNGPVYYKSPLGIFAHLKYASERLYDWTFTVNDRGVYFERQFSAKDRVEFNHTFNVDKTHFGEFEMTVLVTITEFVWPETVALGKLNFVLTDRIPVIVQFTQNHRGLVPENGLLEVSCADIVNASIIINDPFGYFDRNGTQLGTYWKLNNETMLRNDSFSMKYPSKKEVVQDTLEMSLSATDSMGHFVASGSVMTHIEAKCPVLSLKKKGQQTLPKGNLTNLEFSCNASTPIYYCVKYSLATKNASDFNCSESDYIRRDTCDFSVTHYFGNEGNYLVMVGVRNRVNDILHTSPFKNTYAVRIYGVVPQILFRLFIVPISCVILGTIVAVTGYVLYGQTRRNMRIEVADFDFAGNSAPDDLDATLVERTFWTHLTDELADSSPLFRCLARRPPQTSEVATNTSPRADDQPLLDSQCTERVSE